MDNQTEKETFDNSSVAQQISQDINKIEKTLDSNDENIMKKIHMRFAAKYQSFVPDFEQGMECYDYTYEAFNYYDMDKEVLENNLINMEGKLDGYLMYIGLNHPEKTNNAQNNEKSEDNGSTQIFINTSSKSTSKSENSINMSVQFGEAKDKIDKMNGLESDEAKEIKSKIDELEKLNNDHNITKQHKWPMVKKILEYALKKGVDVAMTIMGLVVKMNLGL